MIVRRCGASVYNATMAARKKLARKKRKPAKRKPQPDPTQAAVNALERIIGGPLVPKGKQARR